MVGRAGTDRLSTTARTQFTSVDGTDATQAGGGPRAVLKQPNAPAPELSPGITGAQTPPQAQALTAVTASQTGAHAGRRPRTGARLVTASTVEQLIDSGDLSSVRPAIPRALWPAVRQMATALGIDGPLGDKSPLSKKGVLGDGPMNPQFWMRLVGDWSGLAKALTEAGGPGSRHGPLGRGGPGDLEAMKANLEAMGPLSAQLQASGLFTALGPWGALNALSVLGYLGAMGGHGFAQDEHGRFVDAEGKVQRTTDVAYEGDARTHQLVEVYTEAFAEDMSDNDTTWMVKGHLPPSDADDTFAFTPRQDRTLTLTVVPEDRSDVFAIDLLNERGEVVATSDSKDYMNFIQVDVPAGQPLKARVRRQEGERQGPSLVSTYIDMMLFPLELGAAAMKPWLRDEGVEVPDAQPHGYRLIATGTPETDSAVQGDHQRFVNLS